MNANNIVLTGMPGSGKSTVGKEISTILNLEFVDLDYFIEKNIGVSISEIFETKGESGFRAIETENLKTLLYKNNFVLSCGGGIIETKENLDILKKIGIIFYIKTSIETIYERIKNDKSRPLLQNDNPIKTLQNLYKTREQKYQNIAHYQINGELSPNEIAGEIIKIYEKIRS